MAELERELNIATGRRASDGVLRLSVFAEDLLAVMFERQGDRVPAILLTGAQAEQLRAALDELIPLLSGGCAEGDACAWDGGDRRRRPEAA